MGKVNNHGDVQESDPTFVSKNEKHGDNKISKCFWTDDDNWSFHIDSFVYSFHFFFIYFFGGAGSTIGVFI